MFVYLARPIDQASDISYLGSLTEALGGAFAAAEIGAYHPHRAYLANPHDTSHAEFIDYMNRVALKRADALVAILPTGCPTLGVPSEIEFALAMNKPTWIVTDIRGSIQVQSWQARGASVWDLNKSESFPAGADLRQILRWQPRPDDTDRGSEPAAPQLLVKYAEGAQRLTRAHDTDAGLDLATLEDVKLQRGEQTLVRTGVSAAIPNGWWGRITSRSSTRTRWGLEVHDAVIDAGYTGELMLRVTYLGANMAAEIPAGTRLAQYILHEVWDGLVVETDQLPETARADRGYGSSGH